MFSMFCPMFSFNLPKSIYWMLRRQKNEYWVVTGQLSCLEAESNPGLTKKIQKTLLLLQRINEMHLHLCGRIWKCDNKKLRH